MSDEIDPDDFADTAKTVIQSCAGADDVPARGRLLAEAGLIGVLAPEDVGGLGLPLRFAEPIVRCAGAGLLAFPLIESILVAKAMTEIDPDSATRIVSGELSATIAWNGVADDEVVGGAPMGASVSKILVFDASGGATLGSVGNSMQVEQATDTLDIDTPDAIVRLTGPLSGSKLEGDAVARLRNEANLLRACFIQGSAAQCLSMAGDYAQERVQFGAPLSANQAIRHRLSRDAMAVETMRNGTSRALSVKNANDDMAREAAWIGAAQCGVTVAESAIQVFGGMGFTWDVPLHRHLRQIRAQAIRGQADERLEMLGEELVNMPANPWYEDIANAV